MSTSATEMIPLLVPAAADPYTEAPAYLSYRHLREITLQERVIRTCMSNSYQIGGVFIFTLGCLSAWASVCSVCLCLPVAKTTAITAASLFLDGVAVFGMGKGMERLSSNNYRRSFDAYITRLCLEGGGGNEDAKVIDIHVQRLFPLLNVDLFRYLDFQQFASCYAISAIRNRLVTHLDQCNNEVRTIWIKIIEHHQKTPEDFARLWTNRHYRTHTLDDLTLQQAIIDYLPEELRSNQFVRDAMAQVPIPITLEPFSPTPQPVVAASSSSPTLPPKQWVQFIVNEITFTFERNKLEVSSLFFKNLVDAKGKKSVLDPSKVILSLEIPEDDHDPLAHLLKVLQGSYPKVDLETVQMLYKIAVKYQLDELLRDQLNVIFINPKLQLVNLLDIACVIPWKDLEVDIVTSLTVQISTTPLETLCQQIEKMELVRLSAIAIQRKLLGLRNLLEIQYISCAKYITEKFQKPQFTNHFEVEFLTLIQYAINIEPTLQFLHELEVAHLHDTLKTMLKLYLKDVSNDRFKALSTKVTDHGSSFLKRSLVEALKDALIMIKVKRIYAIEMPNNLNDELFGTPVRMQASSSND